MKTLLTTLLILFTSVVSPVFGEEEKEKSQMELMREQMEEQNNMMSAINQKLAKSWEVDKLAGKSNIGDYKVRVEFTVNSDGFIVSKVKPYEPREPKGNYLLAFELAGKAIMRANPLPILPNKYLSGITFLVFFDPEKGFSF